jgi:hypothetical protein
MSATQNRLLSSYILPTISPSAIQQGQNLFGGYSPVQNLATSPQVAQAQATAEKFYKSTSYGQKDPIVQSVSQEVQLVGGINYKLIYQTKTAKYVKIIVYSVPWASTMKVIDIRLSATNPTN